MNPLMLSAVMAAIHGGQNASKEKEAKQDYVDDMVLQAEQSRYAPYTGVQVQRAKKDKSGKSVLEGLLSGGVAGLKQAQELKAAGIDLGGSGEDVDLDSFNQQQAYKSKLSDKLDFSNKFGG